jgi:hypothetical protein
MLIFYVIMAFCAIFLLIRNEWVYRKRTNLICTNFSEYKKLPSYDYMLWHFWIWNIEKFKEVNNESGQYKI